MTKSSKGGVEARSLARARTRKEEIERDKVHPNGPLVRGNGEKGETQFSMDNKKGGRNNVGRGIVRERASDREKKKERKRERTRDEKNGEESSFGSAKRFVFRDSFALIQSGFRRVASRNVRR